MYNFGSLFDVIGLVSLLTIFSLILTLIFKIDKIKQLQQKVNKLEKSLEEMDEQAKFIVRTDIELNKTQEELDKKLTGLYALQRLSRTISTTLEESQIFKMISAAYLEDLGFEKATVFLWNDLENRFLLYLNIGYVENELDKIKSSVNLDKHVYLSLIKSERTTSSFSILDANVKDKLNTIFTVNSFVIAPLLPKEGNKGFLFVGTDNKDTTITEGDEELITVMGNQVGQALENARLFEKTWQAQQGLEKKVEERTRELSLALEEVKRISKRKTDFISSVSHELRTPLTSIKGYASILLEEKLGQLPPAVKERLQRVNYHSNELANMVNDLLDISRIESGKAIMKLESHNLKDIITAISDLILIQCKNKNIKLVQDIQKDLPYVRVDRGQIERVFINLLGNAVKFTPKDGTITIKAYKKDGVVQVNIQDTGIGIPSDTLSLIFDEFYRVDNPINQQVKGTGLGLSLVKRIIEAHNGMVWVESNFGEGSTFSFTLPL